MLVVIIWCAVPVLVRDVVIDEVDLVMLWTTRKLHYTSMGSIRAQVFDGGELDIEARARVYHEDGRTRTFEHVSSRCRCQRSH